MHASTDVLIAGAGIGGLTLALSLHARGVACQIIEASGELSEVGAGVNLQPNAVEVLSALGLGNELAECAVATEQLHFYSRHGQLIHAQPRGLSGGFSRPQFSIHRARLQTLLLRAVHARLGKDRVHLGTRCVSYSTVAGRVDVQAETRMGAQSNLSSSALIGCDGIHSMVRRSLHPQDGPPQYSGVTMWRGVTLAPTVLGGRTMLLAGSLSSGKLVVYPISQEDGEGRQLMNWVAEKRVSHMSRQDWDARGALVDLDWALRDWGIDGLNVPQLLRSTERVLRYPMVDKDPLPFWTRGRVTLLGDAAHPMYPFGSNGACQAILDAQVLSECLDTASYKGVEQALLAYEARRLPATRDVVLLNRECAPDAILDIVEERAQGKLNVDVECLMPRAERIAVLARYAHVSQAAVERSCDKGRRAAMAADL